MPSMLRPRFIRKSWLRASRSFDLFFQKYIDPAAEKIPFFKKKVAKKKRRRYIIRWSIAIFILSVALFSYATNPFVRFTLIQDPFDTISVQEDRLVVEQESELIVKEDPFFSQVALIKSGWHIVSSKFAGGPKAKKSSVDSIIEDIHQLRFNPELPFLISGDHFSVLYPRSIGIFYHSLLDPRTALDETDWQNRQFIYLKTVAYTLDVYRQSEKLSTTIVPIGPRSVTLMNIYSMPSDTLYSILHGLDTMLSTETLVERYPYQTDLNFDTSLQTRQAALELLRTHEDSLIRHYETFLRDTVDPGTGLVKKDILLSGAKDITKRESAFYDNVMIWKTHHLMQKLNLVEENQAQLDALKQNILSSFWLDREGYFLEDLSDEGVEEKFYSSDWLIAYQVGMLDPEDTEDLEYLTRSVAYIRRNAIDQPFGLQYHPELRRHRQYLAVRLFAPSYGSTAIWSNWGQEYTKLLAHLYQVTGDPEYLMIAEDQIEAYAYNIKRYQGYPELYNDQGDFYRQFFYKSIRQTGWVVSFEQARAMVSWTAQNAILGEETATEDNQN